MDYLKLEGKSAIITGGSQGIGEGISVALAQYGVKVMICDVKDDQSQVIVNAIRKDGGIAEFCHCDVTNVSANQRPT